MRRILVTGGNKGIGLAIARAILDEHEDTFVFLGSRDAERGRAAVETLTTAHPAWGERVAPVGLDVSDDTSVAAAARTIEGPLYAVVNNAGIGHGAPLRAILEVNTRGVRRVCEAFLAKIEPTRGRIVNVTSAAGPSFVATCSAEMQRFFVDASVTWPRLAAFIDACLSMEGDPAAFAARGLGDGAAYGLSKALANTYTMILAREHPNLHVNACTPGFIETDMTRRYALDQGKSPEAVGMKPPAAGARAPMFLLFGALEGNGRYYGSDAKRSPLDRYRSPGSPPYDGA